MTYSVRTDIIRLGAHIYNVYSNGSANITEGACMHSKHRFHSSVSLSISFISQSRDTLDLLRNGGQGVMPLHGNVLEHC